MSAFGTKQTSQEWVPMSAIGGKADVGRTWINGSQMAHKGKSLSQKSQGLIELTY
jgi:hypothetical protein